MDCDGSFFRALLERDGDSLDRLLAPDFLIVDVNAGGVTNRADFLGAVKSGAVTFESIETVDALRTCRLASNGEHASDQRDPTRRPGEKARA